MSPFNLEPTQDAMTRLAAAVAMHNDGEAPDALRRSALHEGVVTIDTLLRELHKLREGLVREGRRDDDETDARVDRLLAERRGEVVIEHPPGWVR